MKTDLLKYRNYLCFFLLLLVGGNAMAQIGGPATVNAGTTHTYTYTQSALVSPNWQVSGGTKIGETYNYANYTVTVTWGAGPNGGLALLDNGMPAATLSVTINAVLTAPVATAATSITPTSFTANWNPVSSATEYWYDVSTTSGFSSFVSGYNNARAWDLTTAFVTGLAANTTYYYRARGATSQGPGPNSNTITVNTPPVAPVALGATSIGATAFSANWSASAGATSYRLDISSSSTFSSFVSGYNDLTVASTSQGVTGLTAGTTYYYRVRAVNASSAVSANSSTITVLTLPDAPVPAAATSITTNSFTASWSSVASATSYLVYVGDTNSPFTANVVNGSSVSTNSLNIAPLTAGKAYYYLVRAVNSSGASTNSSVISLVTLCDAPVSSAASSVTTTTFTANWSASVGASSYRLDVSTNSSFSTFVSDYNDLTVAGTSTNVTGLIDGTTYYYRVRAVNAASLVSANSATITILLLCNPPIASAASAIAANSFTANWSPATGAADYRLDVSTNSSFSSFVTGYNNLTVASTSASVTGLSPATTYYYRVRAVNATGASVSSLTITVLTLCAAPTASAATSITAASFTANWVVAAGATGYRLDVSTNSAFSSFVSTYNNMTVAGTSQSVSGLSPGTTYYYRVRAVNATGASANSSTITVLSIPSSPAFGTTTAFTVSSFTLNWSAIPGAASYRLDISLNSGFSSFISGYNNLSITGTSRAVSGLAAGTTYYCRMRSVNASGTSGNSTTLSIITIPAAPGSLTPNAITATSFTARWAAVTGAASYRLDVSTVSNFSSFVSGYNNLTVAGTSANVTGQAMNTNYYYRIRAINASGTSANSAIITLDLDHNYIRKTTLLKSGYTTAATVDAAPATDKIIQHEFFDGLGRQTQTVIKQGSPAGADVVQATTYDQFGREPIKYLPYADGSSGWYKENALKDPSTGVYTAGKQYQFYQTGGLLASDTKPFSETRFEPSPMNRALEIGAPGLDWQPDATDTYASTDRTVKKAYQVVNSATEVRLWTYTFPTNSPELLGLVNAGTTASPTFYPANKLYRNRSKDEDRNEVLEYKDDQGRVVLRRVQAVATPSAIDDTQYASTYYIYDDFGRLACVLPPEASRIIASGYLSQTNTVKETFLRRWAFRYKYDERGRMVRKQVPGAGQVIMIYDDRDRLVLTQDSVQRAKTPTREWLFMKYDLYSRPVLTGKYLSNNLHTAMKAAVATYYNNLTSSQAWFETYIGSGGAILGYDNKSFPQSTVDADYLTVTYYDKYDTYMAPAGYTYTTQSLVDPETSTAQETVAVINAVRPFGQVTGIQVKNLGTGTWLRTVNYFDQKFRPVQAISDHQKGKVTGSSIIDFSGKVLYTRRTYVVNSVTTYVNENPNYDQMGRLIWTKHSTNGAAEIMVAKNEYNELGQPVDKKLHSTDGGTTFKQSVDSRFNIRGWLKKINEADVSSVAAGDATADYFGMELGYQSALSGVTSTNQFSGNVSAIQWSKGNGGTARRQAYAFGYDNMSRLKDANHFDYERIAGVWSWNSNTNGYGENLTYDLNGNISTLLRKGFKGAAMDNLTYVYSGNQLSYVNDAASATLGFVNGNTGTDDYSYDVNGNLNKDKNKGLNTAGNIKYNFLNLPEEISKSVNEKVKYLYDAAGRKLAQEVYNSSGTLVKTTDYIGEMVYENNALKMLQHSEGRVLPDGANWEYQYFLKDHLGNVRITFTAKTQTASNYTTNFEAATDPNFQNYTNTTFDLVDHTDAAGTVYQKVQWLNGGANGRVGLAKSLAVMPGDQVSITAYAKYMNLGSTSNPNVFINSLAAAFGVSAGSTGEALKIYNGLNSYAASVPGGDHYQDNESAPKGFVTILFFDKDYNLIDAAWDQVTTTGAQTSPTAKQPPHDVMSITAKAPEAGYAFVFLSNEHPNFVDLYFDDVTVSHTPSPIVSTSDYFPFGLSYNSMERTGSLEQKYLYNGKELQDEMALNWYDYGARMYMPEIGRWAVVDPLSEKYTRWNPYAYAFNSPMRFTDPLGLEGNDEVKKSCNCGGEELYSRSYTDENGVKRKDIYYASSEEGSGGGGGGGGFSIGSRLTSALNNSTESMNTKMRDVFSEIASGQQNSKISLSTSSQQAIMDQIVKAIYDAKKGKKSTINLANYFTEFNLSWKERKQAFMKLAYAKKIEGFIKLRDGGRSLKGYMDIALSENHSIIPSSPDGSQDMGEDRQGTYQFFNYNYEDEGSKQLNALLIKGYVESNDDYDRLNNFIWK